ncbi:hypothetical protein H8E07_17435 [bacterium]|nr:hypothetical protein [bacterium]
MRKVIIPGSLLIMMLFANVACERSITGPADKGLVLPINQPVVPVPRGMSFALQVGADLDAIDGCPVTLRQGFKHLDTTTGVDGFTEEMPIQFGLDIDITIHEAQTPRGGFTVGQEFSFNCANDGHDHTLQNGDQYNLLYYTPEARPVQFDQWTPQILDPVSTRWFAKPDWSGSLPAFTAYMASLLGYETIDAYYQYNGVNNNTNARQGILFRVDNTWDLGREGLILFINTEGYMYNDSPVVTSAYFGDDMTGNELVVEGLGWVDAHKARSGGKSNTPGVPIDPHPLYDTYAVRVSGKLNAGDNIVFLEMTDAGKGATAGTDYYKPSDFPIVQWDSRAEECTCPTPGNSGSASCTPRKPCHQSSLVSTTSVNRVVKKGKRCNFTDQTQQPVKYGFGKKGTLSFMFGTGPIKVTAGGEVSGYEEIQIVAAPGTCVCEWLLIKGNRAQWQCTHQFLWFEPETYTFYTRCYDSPGTTATTSCNIQ